MFGVGLCIGFVAMLLPNFYTTGEEIRPAEKTLARETRTAILPEKATTTLVFVGDIMLSRTVGDIMERENDPTYHFQNVKEMLFGADIAVGNLESPISARGEKVGSIYSFRADPRTLEGLVYAGFDVLSIANNHIWDYGPEAATDTIDILRQNSIGVIGGGYDHTDAHRAFVKVVNGVRFAFLGYTDLIPRSVTTTESRPAIALLDREVVLADIKKAKEVADVVIISLHTGEEYATIENESQRKLGRAFIDAGATLVIGHHPHVVQPVERYKDGYIAYSLGNFIFDQNFSEDTGKGLVFRVTFSEKDIAGVEEIPIMFGAGYRPEVK